MTASLSPFQIEYTADRVQINFLQLLNAHAVQRVTLTHHDYYQSTPPVATQTAEAKRTNEKAERLEKLDLQTLLFRGLGKELLGAKDRRPTIIQSTCEVSQSR